MCASAQPFRVLSLILRSGESYFVCQGVCLFLCSFEFAFAFAVRGVSSLRKARQLLQRSRSLLQRLGCNNKERVVMGDLQRPHRVMRAGLKNIVQCA